MYGQTRELNAWAREMTAWARERAGGFGFGFNFFLF